MTVTVAVADGASAPVQPGLSRRAARYRSSAEARHFAARPAPSTTYTPTTERRLRISSSRPVAVFVVTLAAAVVSVLVFESFQVLGALIALYTVARYCDRTTSLGGVGAGTPARAP